MGCHSHEIFHGHRLLGPHLTAGDDAGISRFCAAVRHCPPNRSREAFATRCLPPRRQWTRFCRRALLDGSVLTIVGTLCSSGGTTAGSNITVTPKLGWSQVVVATLPRLSRGSGGYGGSDVGGGEAGDLATAADRD